MPVLRVLTRRDVHSHGHSGGTVAVRRFHPSRDGLEHEQDVIADFLQALTAATD